MKLEDFKNLAEKRVSFYGMTLTCEIEEGFQVRLNVRQKTVDSETLQPIIIDQSDHIAAEFIDRMPEREAVHYLHHFFRQRVIHECDEFFKVDGVAPFHPHR